MPAVADVEGTYGENSIAAGQCVSSKHGAAPITASDNAHGIYGNHQSAFPYWRNSLIAALGVIVMIGGSQLILRSTDNLTVVYVFIAAVAVLVAASGVYVKRRTDRRLQSREQN